EAEGKLTRLATGDGMVLVFANNPEAPVECALEISKALQSHPKLKVRMGIHSGPVNPVAVGPTIKNTRLIQSGPPSPADLSRKIDRQTVASSKHACPAQIRRRI